MLYAREVRSLLEANHDKRRISRRRERRSVACSPESARSAEVRLVMLRSTLYAVSCGMNFAQVPRRQRTNASSRDARVQNHMKAPILAYNV